MRQYILAWAAVAALALPAQAEKIYGLTNFQELVTFDGDVRTVTATTPLAGFNITGEILVSIDVRPATGELYGLSNQNNIYKINPLTGSRTQVGATLATAPMGNLKAIEFNPTVDRIRVVSSGASPNNFRVHPDTGAVIMPLDQPLAFNAGDANFGDTPAVVSAAYTNSFAGATSTTLYNIEAFNDVLTTQAPPNDGKLNTIRPIGFDVVTSGGFTGFDISGATGRAYLTGNSLVGGGLTANSLYAVDLTPGSTAAAALLGPVSGVNGTFRDIAVAAVPEPATIGLLTLAGLATCVIGRRRK
ncbi:MAG: DUF4394 domain-containing protein [Pirellulales bacterium]